MGVRRCGPSEACCCNRCLQQCYNQSGYNWDRRRQQVWRGQSAVRATGSQRWTSGKEVWQRATSAAGGSSNSAVAT